MDFGKDAFVKIVSVSGDYRYGFIKEVEETGFHLLICLHEEGDSAIGYESAAGAEEPDWDKELSDNEKQMVHLLASNFTTKEVAAALSVEPVTIRGHMRTLRLKLGLANRVQLIAFAHGIDKRLKEESCNIER